MYKNVIYIDILIILNLYVTFFLIKGTDTLLHRKTSRINTILGVLIGGISSLIVLLPTLAFLPASILKLISCLSICFVIYQFKDKYIFFKNTAIFLIMNFIFAGIMLFLWFFAAPYGMIYNNGYFYFDVSFAFVAVSTCIAYGLVKIFRYILDVKFSADKKYAVTVKNNNVSISISGFPDTGNTLSDFFSGLPVIICNIKGCEKVLPENMLSFDFNNCTEHIAGIRIIPYSTINSHGFIPVFKPDLIEINGKPVSALLGVSNKTINGDADAIFNPKLLL